MLKLARYALFGKETALGTLLYIAVSLVFGESFSVFSLVGTVFFAHAPDLDFILYLVLKRVGIKLRSHWTIGHHPIPVTFVGGATGWFVAGPYGATLAAVALLCHFACDSVHHTGLHWFSPFLWRHFSIGEWSIRGVPPEEVRRYYDKVRRAQEDGAGEVGIREHALQPHYLLALLACGALVLFALTTGVRL